MSSKEEALRRLDQLEKNLVEKYQQEKARADGLEAVVKVLDPRVIELENKLEGYEKVDKAIEALRNILGVAPKNETTGLIRRTIDLEAAETVIKLSHTLEPVKMSTKTGLGKILYAAVHDLKSKPSSENEISDALQEYGWSMAHSTLAPNLAQLVKQGLLVKEQGKPIRYRTPGKLKIDVEKE